MQACAQMGAPWWEASADGMWNHPSVKNLSQYQTGAGTNWPTSFPGQDGICYQNVSRVSQASFSAVPQGGNYGHQSVSSTVCNYNMGQKWSAWNTGASTCTQNDIAAYHNPTSAAWRPSGALHGHAVVPEHHECTRRLYQKSPPPYSQNHITISGRSIPDADTNQTRLQQPDTRSTLQNALEFQARPVVQETQWQIPGLIAQSILTQAKAQARIPEMTPARTQIRIPEMTPARTQIRIPEMTPARTQIRIPEMTPARTQIRIPEMTQTRMPQRAPTSTQVLMLERMSNRKPITQHSPYSSLHTAWAAEQLRTVCATIPEAAHVAGESTHLSNPDNRSRSQHQTPTEDIPTPQNLEALEPVSTAPSSTSCSAQPTVAITPPVAEGSPELTGQLLASARGPSAQSCAGHKDPRAGGSRDQTASPVWKQQQHNVSQSFQPEEPESREVDQSERPVTVQLKSLSTRKWTQEDLAVLVRNQAQMKSPTSSVLFNWENVISMFWKDTTKLPDTIRAGLYEKDQIEALTFCNEHLSLDSAVLSEAMCDLNLSDLQVLQDGEVYSEAPYSSFWRNINPQLDDIDKEFGLERNLLHHTRLPGPHPPSARVAAEAPSPETKTTSLEEEPQEQKEREEKLQHAQGPELDSVAFVPPTEDPVDVYSFVIKVLPLDQAKAIHDSLHRTEAAPTKNPKGCAETETSVDKGHHKPEKMDPFGTDLESFFEHCNDIQSGSVFLKNQDTAEGIRWTDIDSFLSMDVDNNSVDSNRSEDASPRTQQKDDQAMGNCAAPDDQESENVIQREEDQAMANVSRPEEDYRELANVSQKDDPRSIKVAQEDERVISNVAQQVDHETGKASQKDDSQETAIVSQQKYVQEMAKVLIFPSKVSPPPEMWTLQDSRRHVEVISSKVYQEQKPLCLANKCFQAPKKTYKKSKQFSISIPCLKKIKRVRKDGSQPSISKEAARAKRELPVKLELFGSARRNRDYALAHHAPQIVSVRPKGRSSIKQKIYREWRRPPTRIDGKPKVTFHKKSYVDLARKETPLPTLIFRKDNGRMSLTLNKRKSRPDGPKKDAGALKQAADVLLKTANHYHCDKLHRPSERPPWDHRLRLYAMGTLTGTTTAATIAAGSI
ncbi:uncharacterized protein LOC144044035 [Vanacampus margaritifer]